MKENETIKTGYTWNEKHDDQTHKHFVSLQPAKSDKSEGPIA